MATSVLDSENCRISCQPYSKWRDKLLPIIQKTAENNRHPFAENVDRALLDSKAFLFLSEDGFVALKPFDGDKVCVLFAYSFTQGATMKYQPEIEALSRKIGAKSIVFHTALEGAFIELCKRLGYRKTSQQEHISTWVKEIG
ncbi:hypothetical protein XM73_c20569 [Vibrio vulnificus]|nr:hypothetical protein XM73_c20569 [Vibrio vulnificus]